MKSPVHLWAMATVLGYAVALVLIGFWPSPVDAQAGPWLDRLIGWLHVAGVPEWFGYAQIEFGANIAFFVPLGVLAYWWLRRIWAAGLAGLGVSMLVEAGQLVFLPARYPSLLDLLANTLGAVGGAVLLALVLRWYRRRENPAIAGRQCGGGDGVRGAR